MHLFDSDGFRIAYDDVGRGEPIVLLHGFAANRRINWKLTGWYALLAHAGYRVIAADARGHGGSAKPREPADYRPEGIAGDTVRLLDHLGLRRAHLFGYSMGARNAAWLLANHGDRFLSGVIAGAGMNLLHVDDPERWTSRGFRLTADNARTSGAQRTSLAIAGLEGLYGRAARRGGTLGALAACLLGAFPSMTERELARIRTRTLVICGEKDSLTGSPVPLAECIPDARAVIVPGRSHVSVVADPFFKGAVLGFLGQHWERPARRRTGGAARAPAARVNRRARGRAARAR
jgi:pimeloyl-ACP methyl ester carboxylesterase